MTTLSITAAFLRPLKGFQTAPIFIDASEEIVIERDPSCQVILAGVQYAAAIRLPNGKTIPLSVTSALRVTV